MKKKLVIGLLIVTILGVAAGSHLFNQTSAQDPQKKAEPEKKVEGDLFDLLKKSLEGKKDVPVVPAPVEPVLPPVKDDKVVLPPISSAPSVAPPLAVPPLSDVKPASAQQDVPPVVFTGPLSKPKDAPSAEPTPVVPPVKLTPPSPLNPPNAPMPVNHGIPPYAPLEKNPVPETTIPPAAPANTAATWTLKPQGKPPIPEQLAAIKDCPWSLQVDMVEGKTVVTATVNKKHEFKIVCQSLDLQTGKSVLKATGKVQITGDMMTGTCDHLSISLHEDRLLLEGKAEVSIQKVSTKVSSDASTSFELKGMTLDLRISDYTSAKLVQTSGLSSGNVVEAIPMRNASPALPSTDSKKWTSYGTLRPAKLDLGGKEIAWSLQDREGKVITYLVARDGGTLRQYEGQTISVLGATEQISGRPMLRVTHIALP